MYKLAYNLLLFQILYYLIDVWTISKPAIHFAVKIKRLRFGGRNCGACILFHGLKKCLW